MHVTPPMQDIEAEKRTVAVLTKVDRACQLDTDVAGILREDTDLQLPHLGHRYHAIISRDTQRGSSGNRAKRDRYRGRPPWSPPTSGCFAA